jgi:phytoene synthase
MGRVYLPLQWLREAGIDPDAWLARPVFDPALGSVVQRLLRAADALYERAAGGIAQLPLSCRPGIHAARLLYAGIGHELERRGLDSVHQRTVVPGSRKLLLFGCALAATALPQACAAEPPLAATRFLVEAVAATPAPSVTWLDPERIPWWNLHDRALWVIALFDRLERIDRGQRVGGTGAGP